MNAGYTWTATSVSVSCLEHKWAFSCLFLDLFKEGPTTLFTEIHIYLRSKYDGHKHKIKIFSCVYKICSCFPFSSPVSFWFSSLLCSFYFNALSPHARWWLPWARRGTRSTLCAPTVRKRLAPGTSLSERASHTARKTTTTCSHHDATTVMVPYWMLVMHINTPTCTHIHTDWCTMGGRILVFIYS